MGYFKGKQFKEDIILVAVGYYYRFSLSYRDVSEILKERGVSVHPTTIMRWVHKYGNLIYQIWKKKNKSAHFAWHLDETYIKVRGEWCYLYRAIDREGAIKMCERYKKTLDKVTNILCDGGYTGPFFAQSIKETIDCSVEIIKRSELHEFVVLPKRWIVKQTFAWLENYRRLWKNCERMLENSRPSCLLAGVAILLKRF